MSKVRITLQFHAPKQHILDYLEDVFGYDDMKIEQIEWHYAGDDLAELESYENE